MAVRLSKGLKVPRPQRQLSYKRILARRATHYHTTHRQHNGGQRRQASRNHRHGNSDCSLEGRPRAVSAPEPGQQEGTQGDDDHNDGQPAGEHLHLNQQVGLGLLNLFGLYMEGE